MSNNIRLIIDNLHDTATLAATSSALPVDYTQRSGRSYVWRSVGVATQVVTATLATPSFLDAVVVLNHNLSLTATVRIELLVAGSVVYDSGNQLPSEIKPLGEWIAGVDPWGQSDLSDLPVQQYVLWLPEVTLCDSYRVTINDPLNPDGYVEVGRIFAGQYYSPEYNPSYGLTLEWQDFAEHRRTESGSLRTVGGGAARLVSFDLSFLSQQGLQELSRLLMRAGIGRDIYINLYPGEGGILEAEHAFIARRRNNYSHSHAFFNNWEIPLQYEEI